MKPYEKFKIGFAITGSFCTIKKILPIIESLVSYGYDVIPILSETVAATDTRFGKADVLIDELRNMTNCEPMMNLTEVEPIGPKKMLDVLVVAPCTGNTMAKIANGIADTSVTLAVKSHLRNKRPIVVAVSTNDGLGANAKNIGVLMARQNIYLVPFSQDDFVNKENSLVADFDLVSETISEALKGKQFEPLLL